jgi:hypothetical protein
VRFLQELYSKDAKMARTFDIDYVTRKVMECYRVPESTQQAVLRRRIHRILGIGLRHRLSVKFGVWLDPSFLDERDRKFQTALNHMPIANLICGFVLDCLKWIPEGALDEKKMTEEMKEEMKEKMRVFLELQEGVAEAVVKFHMQQRPVNDWGLFAVVHARLNLGSVGLPTAAAH